MITTTLSKSRLNKADLEWLDKIHRKSKADRSRTVAEISLKTFDRFCKDQGMERHLRLDDEFSIMALSCFNVNASL